MFLTPSCYNAGVEIQGPVLISIRRTYYCDLDGLVVLTLFLYEYKWVESTFIIVLHQDIRD